MLTGQLNPGDVVRWEGRRLYAAAIGLAGRVALEPLGPGDRRGGLSGSSTWLELDVEIELLEAYRARDVAAGAAYDPLLQGAAS